MLERLSELYGPKGLGDEEWEIHWTAELVRRSEELEDWESQLRHIRKLTEIYRREGERHATHGCLIDAEKILQKLLTQSAEAENAIRYCENLIGIYSGLNLDEKVKEHQQKLEALKESRRIHIWLPPGAVAIEDGRPVLRAGQPYTFYVQIGAPPTEYAWMEGADFRYAETQAPRADGKREGIRISYEAAPPSPTLEQDDGASSEISPKVAEEQSDAVVPAPDDGQDEEPESEPLTPEPDITDKPALRTTVFFKFEGDAVRFDASEKEVFLWKAGYSDILRLIVIPETSGDHRISSSVTTADYQFQDKFEIPLRVSGRIQSPLKVPKVSLPPLRGRSEKDGAEMVLIPAGEFQMGSPDGEGRDAEHPQHTVYLDAFYIDIHPVTNAQYHQFVKETGHPAPKGYGFVDGDLRGDFEPWKDSRFNGDDQPVVCVSWRDAMAYCKWAGKTLPTEAQWEKAARGGLVGKRYPRGDEIDQRVADYGMDVGHTTPVSSYPPNAYGIYDMAGNVWEWCLDEWDADFYQKSPKDNPVAGEGVTYVTNDFTNVKATRVLRGGSWLNDGNALRVAYRSGVGPTSTDLNLGFRFARTLTP